MTRAHEKTLQDAGDGSTGYEAVADAPVATQIAIGVLETLAERLPSEALAGPQGAAVAADVAPLCKIIKRDINTGDYKSTKVAMGVIATKTVIAYLWQKLPFYNSPQIKMNSPQIKVNSPPQIKMNSLQIYFGTYRTNNFHQNGPGNLRVQFPNAFNEPPKVMAAFNKIEASNHANLRLNSTIEDITTDGFTLKMETWNDSRVWSAGITWIAIPSNLGNVYRKTFPFGKDNLSTLGERAYNENETVNFDTVQHYLHGNENETVNFDTVQHYLHGAAISRLDFDNSTNIRLNVSTEYQQDDRSLGCSASTWGNTKAATNGASFFICKAPKEYIQKGYHSFRFNDSPESMRQTVIFKPVFKTKPNAVVMLSYIDIETGNDTRVSAEVVNVAEERMVIEVRQSNSSRNLYRIGVTWIAVASH